MQVKIKKKFSQRRKGSKERKEKGLKKLCELCGKSFAPLRETSTLSTETLSTKFQPTKISKQLSGSISTVKCRN